MKTKFWNGSFLRTVLQCLAIACAALLALSALGAGLVLGGVVDQKQIPAAACCICFAAVFSRKLSGCEAYGREAAACCTCGCGLLLCGLLSGAADGFRKYAGTYADSGGLYACGRASCGHSGRYTEKERSPTQAMKEFLHTTKCKYNLLSVHTSKHFLSFQDFDPHTRMRHHMLCFLQKVVDFNAGAVPLLT